MRKSFQSGQVGLVVLLVASVLLTLGIGIASQSVLETKTATQETDSSKILNVTERAIERALQNLTSPGEDYGVPLTISGKYDSYTTQLQSGDVAQLDLDDGTYTSSLETLQWTRDPLDCDATPAIVLTFISGGDGEYVTRYAYDSCAASRGDGFSDALSCMGNVCGIDVSSLNPLLSPQLVRIKVLYSQTELTAMLSGQVIQSYVVSAEGSDDQTGETRSVTAVRSNPAVPSIFDYALYSGSGDISQ